MQLTIPGLGTDDKAKLGQLRLLFPSSPSENQELLETLKREYSGGPYSEREKKEIAKAITEEKERPVKPR